MTTRTRNRLTALIFGLALLLGVGVLTACGPTIQSIPMPGEGVSGKTITITMDFADALNLAQGAPVKVNGVAEGKVSSIAVDDFHARATVVVKDSADLRQGMTANLRYTTPLGELYVDVTNPAKGSLLVDGAHVGLAATTTAPTVEDALSEASLLINGGGLGSLENITTELNNALGGKEGVWRDLLSQTDAFVTTANGTTKDIDAALNALADVSQTLTQRKATIDRALKEIAPAAQVLQKATPDFTKLLASLKTFSKQANSTVGRTRASLIAAVTEVEPVLATLAAAKGKWAGSLQELELLGKEIKKVIPGDYLNVYLTLHLDGTTVGAPGSGSSTGPKPSSGPSEPGGILPSLLPSLPGGIVPSSILGVPLPTISIPGLGVLGDTR